MKYQNCRKDELVKFANDRGVVVQMSMRSRSAQRTPHKRNYIAALKIADRTPTFRFLSLPPECRNIVYRELLVLRNSFTCHPQILCVNREIQSEATTILYGDNQIDIKIHADGVYTHGKKHGEYNPSLQPDHIDFGQLIWPQFIRRAQFLRISTAPELWVHPTARRVVSKWACVQAISNAVYSVSVYLADQNRLRSFDIDFNCPGITLVGSQGNWQRAVASACYPLKLLSSKANCKILCSDIVELDGVNVRTLAPSTLGHNTIQAKALRLVECVAVTHQLANKPAENAFAELAAFVGGNVIIATSVASQMYRNPIPDWISVTTGVTNALRSILENSRLDHSALHEQAQQLIRYEIDLSMALQ